MTEAEFRRSRRPIFSVVIPAFNRAGTILPTLESVRSQTFKDFECIVVDDGSEDGAALRAVIENLDDARFRYLFRPNGGGGAARNSGILESRGRYIAFLDSDDLFLPEKLRDDSHALTKATPHDVLFSQILADRGSRKLVKPERGPKPGEDISEYLTCARGFTQTSTLVVPTELATRVLFTEGLPFGQDTDFAIRLQAAGAIFTMRPVVSVIMNDRIDVGRVSQQRNYHAMLQWIEDIRPLITERAYFAYRGWHIARLASSSDKIFALKLYFEALIKGALPPILAAISLAQILFPRRIYRTLDLRARKTFSPLNKP